MHVSLQYFEEVLLLRVFPDGNRHGDRYSWTCLVRVVRRDNCKVAELYGVTTLWPTGARRPIMNALADLDCTWVRYRRDGKWGHRPIVRDF